MLDFIKDNPVDVLITDFTMPFLNGIELTLKLRAKFPSLKILMLTVNDEPEIIKEAYAAGVSGYLLKTAGKKELKQAIETLAKGEKYLNHQIMSGLLVILPTEAFEENESLNKLTLREREIIKLIANEYSSLQIAEKLFISQGTVETHRHNILRKLNVKNSIGITKYAIKYQLIKAES